MPELGFILTKISIYLLVGEEFLTDSHVANEGRINYGFDW